MSRNDDFMTEDEKIVLVGVLIGFIGVTMSCIFVMFICVTKRSIEVLNSNERNADIENQVVMLDITDKNIDCSICLDTDESDVVGLSLCGHKFHKNCICNLNMCPMCRAIINNDQQEL